MVVEFIGDEKTVEWFCLTLDGISFIFRSRTIEIHRVQLFRLNVLLLLDALRMMNTKNSST